MGRRRALHNRVPGLWPCGRNESNTVSGSVATIRNTYSHLAASAGSFEADSRSLSIGQISRAQESLSLSVSFFRLGFRMSNNTTLRVIALSAGSDHFKDGNPGLERCDPESSNHTCVWFRCENLRADRDSKFVQGPGSDESVMDFDKRMECSVGFWSSSHRSRELIQIPVQASTS